MADLAADLALALDPVAMMQAAGIDPDPWQADLLRSGAPAVLMLCSRQAGKSTTAAAMALHEALYRPPALVLLLSSSLRQSQELFKTVADLYLDVGRPVDAEQSSALRLGLANGSRIVSLPGKEKTVRGYSGVRLLVIDEASRVDDNLYYSVRPMLAVSGGRLVALSTPFGRRGWFFHEWEEGGDDWRRVKVTAYDCPRISAEFLEKELATIGSWWFEQEYQVRFVEGLDQVFSYEEVMQAISAEVQPLSWGVYD